MAASTEGTSDPPDEQGLAPVDLATLARSTPGRKPVWSHQSADLNLNLISSTAGQEIASHVNTEVDVALVGVEGTGSVEIDGRTHPIAPGHLVVIPRGSQRAMRCDGSPFAFLTCYRRRAGLMPAMARRGLNGARDAACASRRFKTGSSALRFCRRRGCWDRSSRSLSRAKRGTVPRDDSSRVRVRQTAVARRIR